MTLLHVSQGVATFSESETRKCIACVAVQCKRGIRRATLCGMQLRTGKYGLQPSRTRAKPWVSSQITRTLDDDKAYHRYTERMTLWRSNSTPKVISDR
jgi:hypothetical protein